MHMLMSSPSIEARLRDSGEVVGLEDYVLLCRQDGGILLRFDSITYFLDIEIPEEVFADPIFQQVYSSAADMVCWGDLNVCFTLTRA